MNHQGLRWNVHCVANVALRIRLNLYKRGFKIYDLLVNRAAMGRARFIIYPWFNFFFFNRAAMGRARFIIYPWFNFLTARPWAERGS